jgi:ribose transport system substrate-binding protein
MRLFAAALVACSTMMCAGGAQADETPTIAVFTKNSTNPAYEAFRLGADQVARIAGARTVHFVPRQPDNIEEQKAMVEQVLKNPPAAVTMSRWSSRSDNSTPPGFRSCLLPIRCPGSS